MPDPGTLDPIDDAAPPADCEPTDAHDLAVQAALYKAAIGGKRWRETVSNGQIVMIEEEVRPDVGAAKKWLEARRPQQWADKRTQEFRVIVARLGVGSEREAVGLVIEGETLPAISAPE